MITTEQARELQARTTLIHSQILHEHGSVADAPTQLAQSALHNLMASLCNREDTTLHGRYNFQAPTGFGKSTACAAFLVAAWQLKLLGNGVSVSYAATRVSQLYDFETILLDAGIPKDELRRFVSVLHNSKDVRRASDDNLDAPVLLITHERIRQVYRGREHHDLCYFLKYRGEARDLLLWDERCLTTENGTIKLDDLKQSIAALRVMYGEETTHKAYLSWMDASYAAIAEEVSRLSRLDSTGNPASSGNLLPLLPPADTQTFYSLLTTQCRRLKRESLKDLKDFLECLRFKTRVVSTSNSGVGMVHFRVVIPNEAKRVINLDAGFGLSVLSQCSSRAEHGLLDAEAVLPMLKQMHTRYGKKLRDLKDCTAHTFIHWQHGAGKDVVARDTTSYLNGLAEPGNVMLEVVHNVKSWIAEGKAVIIWTHKTSRQLNDIKGAVTKCLVKAGIHLDALTFTDTREKDITKSMKRQVVVETYGQHDAVNCYSYTQVAIHLGIQQREETDIAGALCGESHDISRSLPFSTITQARTGEKAVVLQQSTGRSCSRIVTNGKCHKQITFYICFDTKGDNLTETVKPWFPRSTWEEYEPVYAQLHQEGVVSKWTDTVVEYLTTNPEPISSRGLKQRVNASGLAPTTWTRVAKLTCERIGWDLDGGILRPSILLNVS